MPVADALETLTPLRTDRTLLITNQGSAREWPKLCDTHPLDFHYIPSAMSEAIPLAVGLAIARPDLAVWVMTGDGSLIMNLGCLITAAAAAPANLSIFLIDNGVYEVTGGQKTPSSQVDVDFAALASGSGIKSVLRANETRMWGARVGGFFDLPGPRFAWLEVEPVFENYLLDPPCPIAEQLERLQLALVDHDRGHQTDH
jgi:thiamine pyrophosphate-dependent acetolactate synthase large subunit-like protein